jgi:sterol desaturase/sphingolipid hydroxylase (fatty acid hydroxylase superfamily)
LVDWSLVNLALSFAAFGIMARLWPCNAGLPRFVSRDLPDNVIYWLVSVLAYGGAVAFLVRGGLGLIFGAQGAQASAKVFAGYGWAAALPVAAQALLVIVALDFVQYWLHRLFHSPALWPFHAIHHSAVQLEWTTTYRIHPVNFVVYGAGSLALVQVLGFSPAAFAICALFNGLMGPLVHANVNWSFWPVRWLIASPVYHRWHHVNDPAIYGRNFAPNFPVWDLMFGTYHLPKGELPQSYGVDGVPPHFLAQMVWPFQELARRFAPARKPRPDPAAA